MQNFSTSKTDNEEVEPRETPNPVEYRKLSLADVRSVHYSLCDAPSSKHRSTRTLYVVGAPEEKAIQILTILHQSFKGKSSVKLRWWREGPPRYGSKGSTDGEWVGYDPLRGSFSVSESYKDPATIVLYYNDSDPARLLESVHDGDLLLLEPHRLLFPVTEYILDTESCKNILCTTYAPLSVVKSTSTSYFAPIPLSRLRWLTPDVLCQAGGKKFSLGRMNSDFEWFISRRSRRQV